MIKKVIIGEAIILIATFLLASFYHWEINPDNWPVEHRGGIIAIYLFAAIIACPIALIAHADVNNEPEITKDYVGKDFIHKEKGKVRVNYLGSAKRNDESVYFVKYTSLTDGHTFEDFLDDFQKATKADEVKLLANSSEN